MSDLEDLALFLASSFEGFVEGKRIDLFKDGLERDEGLLKNLMPVVLSEVNDDWNEHGEGLVLVGFQNVQKVVIFEEAHSSIGDLEVDAADALDDPLEELVNEVIDFVDFTDFQYLLELSQEEGLLDAIGERPVLEEALKKRDGQSSIFGQEEHGASE